VAIPGIALVTDMAILLRHWLTSPNLVPGDS
jgi:hypothetical protein